MASTYRRGKEIKATPELPEGPSILRNAWEHFNATSDLSKDVLGIPASDRWNAYRERIRRNISSFPTAEAAILFGQSRVEFGNNTPAKDCVHLFDLHAQTLKSEFPHYSDVLDELGDSPYSNPVTLLQVKGRFLSQMYFVHIYYLLQCLTWLPKLDLVCEIGGGYGGLARLWLLNPIHPPQTYVIIDFPEALFFAEVFIRSNFPTTDVDYVTDSKPLDLNFAKKQRFILCPIHHLQALSGLPVDLVVNTGSLQEMSEEWVDFWMSWLRDQSCRYFYSMNYFAQPLGHLAESNNTWSPRLGAEWSTLMMRSNPAYFMQHTTHNFAEIIAEKTGIPAAVSKSELLTRYERARQRVLDGQGLLECMEIFRFGPGEDVAWDLTQRMVELRRIPKEAYYLSELLRKNCSEAFRSRHGEALDKLYSQLRRIRAAGLENRICP